MGYWGLAIGRCFLCLLETILGGLNFRSSSVRKPDHADSNTVPSSANS